MTTRQSFSLLDPTLLAPAIASALRKLSPRVQWRNPVMFVVYIGSILTTLLWIQALGGLGEVFTAQERYEEARQHFHEAFTMASSLHDTPLTLWVLTGIAALLAKEGEKGRSVELLGLVLNHYATPQEARDKAAAVLNDLQADLSDPVLAEALERGKGMALDAIEAARLRLGMDEGQRWLT